MCVSVSVCVCVCVSVSVSVCVCAYIYMYIYIYICSNSNLKAIVQHTHTVPSALGLYSIYSICLHHWNSHQFVQCSANKVPIQLERAGQLCLLSCLLCHTAQELQSEGLLLVLLFGLFSAGHHSQFVRE